MKLSSDQIQLTKNILFTQLIEFKNNNQCEGLQKDIKEVLSILYEQQEDLRRTQYL